MNLLPIRVLFVAAALYDGFLGLLFLFTGAWIFNLLGVTPPNHLGYLHFPAALLLVFALMFAALAREPRANRNLILYGMLLKVAYCGVVFYHWLAGGVPPMWKPFAFFDLAFLLLFAWAFGALKPASESKGD